MMMMTMTMMMMMMISTCCWLAPPRSPSPAFSPTSSPTHPGSTSTWGEEGNEVHGNGFCLNDLYIPSPKCTSTFSTLSSFIIFWSHLDSKCHHWQLCNGAERKLWWQEDGWGEKLTTYTLPSLTSLLATVLHKLPALVGARTETNQHSRCISFRDKSYEPNRSHGGFTFAKKGINLNLNLLTTFTAILTSAIIICITFRQSVFLMASPARCSPTHTCLMPTHNYQLATTNYE